VTAFWGSGTVATSVGRVAYLRAGSSGPPVVLLHSLGLDAGSWRPTAEVLVPDLTVYAVDLPGHGDSPGPRTLLTIEDYAVVVAEACAALGLDRVHLVGNSFGSVVAAEVAARFPDLVASVALVGCPAWSDRTVREEWLHSRAGLLLDAEGEPVEVGRELVDGMFPQAEDSYVAVLRTGFRKAGTWMRNVLWALYAYDSTPTFAEIRQPCLVVYGEHDWLRSTEPHLLGLLPNGTCATVAGGAHMTPVNRPRELADVLAAHVAAHAGAGAGS
jgi:pimeloyl-ACP methyl ester carboxylesterase